MTSGGGSDSVCSGSEGPGSLCTVGGGTYADSSTCSSGGGTCDAPKPGGPLTTRQPAEYKWRSGYPTPL